MIAPRKFSLLVLASLGVWALSGCGGGGSSGTAIIGSVSASTSSLIQGLQVRVQKAGDGFNEVYDVSDSGSFKATKLPEGEVSVSLEKTTSGTQPMLLSLELTKGDSTYLGIDVLTWTPEPVGEWATKESSGGAYGTIRPLAPTGSTLSITGDGSHLIETPNNLKVTKKPDGSVVVDTSGYTGS